MVRSDSCTGVAVRLRILNCGCGLTERALVSAHMYCSRNTPQMLPVHTLGAAQSVACVGIVHDVRQALLPVLQLNPPAQVPVVEVWQVPVPLHSRGCTNVAPVLQLPATQVVPLAYFRQPPEPSQVPSLPHVATAATAHCAATTGAVPAGTS